MAPQKDSHCGSPACRASGKSTVAGLVAGRLRTLGVEQIEVLDGDIVREGLCRDLGFSREDRTENIRRIAFVSKLLTRNNVAVIVAAISPYREDRELAREEIQSFVEVWCHASVDACAARDYKGLYEKARRGEIDNFTGVNDPYEEPEDADLVLDTDERAARGERRARDGAPARARAAAGELAGSARTASARTSVTRLLAASGRRSWRSHACRHPLGLA